MKKFIAVVWMFLLLFISAAAQDVTLPGPAPCSAAAASGTWTVPCNVTSITVEVYGAGGGAGGGGGGSNGGLFNTRGGGGGGGGGYTTITINVVPGSSFNYTIGSGGCGGSNGSDGSGGGNGNSAGGSSTFTGTAQGGTPVNLLANRGAVGTGGSGTAGSPGNGGAGGTASGGTTNTTGAAGVAGSGGNGGAGGAGAGPAGGAGGASTSAAGSTYGGGGGGGGNSTGGVGAPGGILITYVTTTALPVTPTISSTPAGCSSPGTSTISNYNAGSTYTFTPTGPTVGAGGAINGMTTGTSYTVVDGAGACATPPSNPFSNAAALPAPVATITGSLTYCAGGNTILTASGGTSYTWADAGLNIIGNTASVTITQGTYAVLVSDPNGCNDTAFAVVTAFALPVVSISGTLSYCAGGNTTLTANGGTGYVWNDAGNSTTPSITVTQGTYNVTGTDANGCTASASATVTQNAVPAVAITGQLSYCIGSNTTLTATGGTNYVWNDAGTSTTASITVTQGTYAVTATDVNSCTATTSATVTEISTLPVTITGQLSYCPGSNTTITANGGTSYVWNDAGSSTTASITVTQGTYNVTGTDANGGTGTATATVTAATAPTITISGALNYCTGANTTLTANGGAGYLWNDAGNSTTATVTVTQGNYTVTGTDANGCTATANAVVTENPAPNAAISGLLVYCTGGNTTLTATGGAGYLWNDAGNSTTASITVTQGTYNVTATDANGCTGTASVVVTESSSLSVNINGVLSYCTGANTTITATGGTGYVWSNGSTAASITVTQGTYSVTATDATCSGTSSAVVSQIATTPVNLGSAVSTCQDSLIVIDAGTGYTSYAWSSGENTQTITPQTSGAYSVTVVDANSCTVSGSVNVSFNSCTEETNVLYIPTAFSPNGDGANDLFRVKTSSALKRYNIKIYNRWGEQVFESADITESWDGVYQGRTQPLSSYVWYLEYTFNDGKKHTQTGNVTLVR